MGGWSLEIYLSHRQDQTRDSNRPNFFVPGKINNHLDFCFYNLYYIIER